MLAVCVACPRTSRLRATLPLLTCLPFVWMVRLVLAMHGCVICFVWCGCLVARVVQVVFLMLCLGQLESSQACSLGTSCWRDWFLLPTPLQTCLKRIWWAVVKLAE